jgi:hypothetical protein
VGAGLGGYPVGALIVNTPNKLLVLKLGSFPGAYVRAAKRRDLGQVWQALPSSTQAMLTKRGVGAVELAEMLAAAASRPLAAGLARKRQP